MRSISPFRYGVAIKAGGSAYVYRRCTAQCSRTGRGRYIPDPRHAAFLLEVFHFIALFGNRSRRIFDDARTHYHIRLLQFVAGDILYVQIDSYHAVMEVEGLVHTQV